MKTPSLIKPAVNGHVHIRIDDYCTIPQARLIARQILSVADDAENAKLRDELDRLQRVNGEQLVGPW